jgi:hypothetical protein
VGCPLARIDGHLAEIARRRDGVSGGGYDILPGVMNRHAGGVPVVVAL